jgi:hypothetical protein
MSSPVPAIRREPFADFVQSHAFDTFSSVETIMPGFEPSVRMLMIDKMGDDHLHAVLTRGWRVNGKVTSDSTFQDTWNCEHHTDTNQMVLLGHKAPRYNKVNPSVFRGRQRGLALHFGPTVTHKLHSFQKLPSHSRSTLHRLSKRRPLGRAIAARVLQTLLPAAPVPTIRRPQREADGSYGLVLPLCCYCTITPSGAYLHYARWDSRQS